ncbi:hypothetical protein D3C72_2071210 [compost metagenome]
MQGGHFAQTEGAAVQQPERQQRIHHQEAQAIHGLARHCRDEQRGGANDGQPQGQVDTPAQFGRVEAIHELAETLLDEDPAGAARGAVGTGRAHPVGIDERPLQQRRHDQPDQVGGEQGQQAVEPAGKQVGAQPTEYADAQQRWR